MATTSKPRGKTAKMSDAQEWDLVAGKVRDNAEQLRAMTSHGELFRWSRDNDLDKPWLFKKFKTELRKQLDVDYDALRAAVQEQRRAEIADKAGAGPHVTLWAAGDAEAESFAIADREGTVLWYGEFFDDDRLYREGEQDTADTSAAEKAVWLAGKVIEDAGAEAGRLQLTVSNHEVDQDVIAAAAVKARLVVAIEISDDINPALEWCRENGSKSWREVRLSDLIDTDTTTGVARETPVPARDRDGGGALPGEVA